MPRKKGADMEKSIEQTFAELDELMEKLESPDTSLEESFACYEAGMKLVKACSDKIDKVEKQMIILQGGAEEDGDA
ncbi:exodeoxyribonuclease VII small subunit [Clostridium sp. OM02-18AC]|nr:MULTISPECIES: exodeoxyribonuclease VII small subunit [unclassified Clostridium]RHP42753.1 exodeoxyribonuclease VII small subunit [Clostridium sp. AF32-12BH]RHV69907.1 exodeoxyribonuclease VII small subunit [Clostridium sp. OM02-18AC]